MACKVCKSCDDRPSRHQVLQLYLGGLLELRLSASIHYIHVYFQTKQGCSLDGTRSCGAALKRVHSPSPNVPGEDKADLNFIVKNFPVFPQEISETTEQTVLSTLGLFTEDWVEFKLTLIISLDLADLPFPLRKKSRGRH